MSSKKNLDPNAKLGMLERIGYGIGDYAGNLIYSAISAFLLVYYSNVVGVSTTVAASIIAISKVFDGISDLAMGYIIDHTHSKYGKARPWLLRLCLPLAICTVLMFSVPTSLEGKVRIAYIFLTYNLVSTIFYTGINVPYATLNGLMTTNQYERGVLGNVRMLLATAGTMTINTVVLKMTKFFGGGEQYSQKGWTITFIVLMIVFVVLNFITFITCTERVTIREREMAANGEANEVEAEKKNEVGFVKGIIGLLKNKYWVLLVIATFCMYFMMSTFYGSAVYFAQYKLGDPNKYTPISNYLSIAQIVTMFITPFIMKKLSKKNLFLIGMAFAAAGFIITGLTDSTSVVYAMSIIKGIGFGCAAATMFGMLQDAITYGEWQNGYGSSGMGNAASSFCMKIGSGIGTAALGWILGSQFDGTKEVQSAAVITRINVAFSWVPAIAMLVAVVCLVLFDLDKYYDKAVADLEEGKHKCDSEQ